MTAGIGGLLKQQFSAHAVDHVEIVKHHQKASRLRLGDIALSRKRHSLT
jgi:hypothetical protein